MAFPAHQGAIGQTWLPYLSVTAAVTNLLRPSRLGLVPCAAHQSGSVEVGIDLVVELLDDLCWRVLGRTDCGPSTCLVARQELAQGRHVRQDDLACGRVRSFAEIARREGKSKGTSAFWRRLRSCRPERYPQSPTAASIKMFRSQHWRALCRFHGNYHPDACLRSGVERFESDPGEPTQQCLNSRSRWTGLGSA